MEVDDLDFKNQFYNLQGDHYNERKKNFALLLNSTDPKILARHSDLEPRNYLERIFYVDILICAKQVEKLVELLREGDGVLTSRILKQKWFFQEFFNTMSEKTIVNEFLPTLSYCLRMKVLKKLALSFNEQKMDNIFDCLFERYGLFISQQFLFSCSPAKIGQVFRNNKITLSVEQLKRILDKDSNLVKIYLEEYKKNTGQDFHDPYYFSYLYWKYPNLYFEFLPYNRKSLKAGRQTTKAILKTHKEQVLKEVDKIQEKFNIAAVTRKVKEFDKEYLPKFFSTNMNRNNWRIIINYLKKYPHKKRWDVFSTAFTKVYNDSVVNHLKLFEEPLANIFPKEIKQKWAELKYKETGNLTYVKHYEPKKAFELLKEKINVTSSIYERGSMLRDLIKICHTNKDYNTYLEVLKYICMRHRNDDKYLREQLINEIQRNINYELSTEAFWGYVNQLVDVFRVKGETLPFESISQYLLFRKQKNLPLEEPIIAQYVKDTANQTYVQWQFAYFDKHPTIKSDILKLVAIHLHTIKPQEKQVTLTVDLMKTIVNFNSKHLDLQIDLNSCPFIGSLVNSLLGKEDISEDQESECIKYLVLNNYGKDAGKPLKCDEAHLLDIVKKLCVKDRGNKWDNTLLEILKTRTTEFQHHLLEYYFKEYLSSSSYYSRKNAVKYFLDKEPKVIEKYFEQVLTLELRNTFLNFSIIKLYSHLQLDEKLIEHFKPLVAVDSKSESKISVIERLSKVMATEKFINLTSVYVPLKSKLDPDDSEQKSIYEAQCAVAKAFKNLTGWVKLIPLLSPFCQGDYLQSSLALLYRVSYKTNEAHVTSIVNILMQRAVSARKHAVYLGFELLPQKSVLDVFSIVSTREKDVSAKKYLFKAVLKYFLKNPSEYLLGRVMSNIAFIDKNDKELLTTVAECVNNVPVKFRPIFVEHLWEFFEVVEKQGVKVHEYQRKVLNIIITYEVAFFSTIKEDFCRKVIKEFFFSENMMVMARMMFSFVAKYLLSRKDENHFKYVFGFISDFKSLHWESNDTDKLSPVFEFFNTILKEFLIQDVEFTKLFQTYWQLTFNHEESFSEYVVLRLVMLYEENHDLMQFAKGVNKVLKELVLEYGPYINNILVECIKSFFTYRDALSGNTHNLYSNFAKLLLEVEKSRLNCFVAAQLVAVGSKAARSDIVNILKTVDDFGTRVHYNNLLKRDTNSY